MAQTMEKFSFHKYSGHGNDFVIIDNWNGQVPEAEQARVSQLLSRQKFGIGADGVVFIGSGPEEVDFAVRFFNSDGSEADMCGNASRCVAHLAHYVNIATANMTFKTKAGIVESLVKDKYVSVQLPKISRPEGAALVDVEGFSQTYYRINTGVSHAVAFLDELDNLNVNKIGRVVRHHSSFSPEGANVDFVKVVEDNVLDVRTYERGVEAETLACGTGVTAASLLAAHRGLVTGPSVLCHTRGGEDLTVRFEGSPDAPEKVFLEGAVRHVFSGQVESDIFKK
ncbi:MAG: diaminopimelate epimerase [Deltaproteobacteria bacterium]|jgi:diaminopimelate epimerase|nr:diaminopimelate epimerase [Deltaproteobacteria bacterium]